MGYQKKYEQWLSCGDPDIVNDLKNLSNKEIKERFCKDIEFGTGGLRGIIGSGTALMNKYTIRKATQGYADYISHISIQAKSKGVAISFDNRRKSKEFALEAAKVLAANEIKVYLFTSLRPTPELSFAVRELGCFGGIMITASHNPPDYNGYKLYDENGCQLVPKYTDEIIKYINKIESGLSVVCSPEGSEYIHKIGKEIDEKFYQEISSIQINPEINKNNLKIVYSPLHGTGNIPVHTVLKNNGYTVISVDEQCMPDEDFSNTKSPNPETDEAFELAYIKAKEENADIILVTDPDCDRVGVAVKHNNEYTKLTGNQVGAVLLEYILSNKKKQNAISSTNVLINTIVTSDLGDCIARDYGIKTEKTLTGFKFIGDKIEQKQDDFIFGYEESYGYLISGFVRDKDAVQASLLICEACAFYNTHGKTLYDVLNSLYEKHGYFIDSLESVTKKGEQGLRETKQLMENLRNNSPSELAGLKVSKIEDYINGPKHSDDIPNADVIKIFLENGSWIAIRPSGTEPKCKFYFSARGKEKAEAQLLLKQLKSIFLT